MPVPQSGQMWLQKPIRARRATFPLGASSEHGLVLASRFCRAISHMSEWLVPRGCSCPAPVRSMSSLAIVLLSICFTYLSNIIAISAGIEPCLSKRPRCRNRLLTMEEPSSWSSDLVHTPLEPARVVAKSKSMMWTTTSSPIRLQALRTQHTTISEACRGWAKSNSSPETSANSLSLLSSLSLLLRGRSVSSSSPRHSSMEEEPGSCGAPCGVGLVSRRSTSAWYVQLCLNSY